MAETSVKVRGYRELQKAFKVADKALKKELRDALKDVAEPVREDAQQLARSSISHIGNDWAQMRTGITTKVVYVAPKQKGTRDRSRKRPKLATLLAGKSLEPALERNKHQLEARVGRALDTVGNAWEHA